MPVQDLGSERRARLAAARLYLVCDSMSDRPAADGRSLPDVLRAAIAGGVQVVQLRDKQLADDELVAVANAVRALCERLGALFIVNDRPLVASEVGADGVHLGQEDMPVAEAREVLGADMLIGLSTHAPGEIDAALASTAKGTPLVDYIGVGPVHETPTKPGRPAVGVELVRYAAASASAPFFAIGGLRADNVSEVLAAGASRVVVLRAITQAEDPERAARELRAQLDASAARAPEDQVAGAGS